MPTNSSNKAIIYPSGTTANRPTAVNNGYIYFNTTIGALQIYQNGSWYVLTNINAPGTPTSLGSTNQGTSRAYNNGQASIAFTPATETVGFPATYTITPSPATSPTTFTGTSSPIIVTGLISGTSYTYTATATNNTGTSSASSASSAVIATTVPQAPTIGSGTASNTQVSVTFTDLNSVTNSSFEGGSVTGYNSANSTPIASTDFAYVGTYSSKTTLANTSDTNICYWGGATVASAGTYAASAWFYIPANSTLPSGTTVSLTYEGANGTTISNPGTTLIKGSWVKANSIFSFTTTTYGPIVGRISVAPSLYQGQFVYSDLWSVMDANKCGGQTIDSYTITSSPSGITATGKSSPIVVTGLTNGTAYTFTAIATNTNGTSIASSASASVTPANLSTVTGGTLSTDATYNYRTFTSTNNLVVSNATLSADILVIAGGGSGGDGGMNGGGGAGGLLGFTSQSLTAGTYTCTVGGGGPSNTNGVDSQFGSLTLVKGGGYGKGIAGGSGGGNQGTGGAGTAGPPRQGYDGSSSNGVGYNCWPIGGGGGAGAAGNPPPNNSTGGAGGSGTNVYSTWLSAITPQMTGVTGWGAATTTGYIAGGGGGGTYGTAGNNGVGHTVGVGGAGGGGNGCTTANGTVGITNTGGGGGGGRDSVGMSGGSGIIIVRYLKSAAV